MDNIMILEHFPETYFKNSSSQVRRILFMRWEEDYSSDESIVKR